MYTKMNTKEKCDMILTSLVGEKHVRIWWGSCNKSFDYVTPAEVFMVDPERVLNYLLEHAYGGW